MELKLPPRSTAKALVSVCIKIRNAFRRRRRRRAQLCSGAQVKFRLSLETPTRAKLKPISEKRRHDLDDCCASQAMQANRVAWHSFAVSQSRRVIYPLAYLSLTEIDTNVPQRASERETANTISGSGKSFTFRFGLRFGWAVMSVYSM